MKTTMAVLAAASAGGLYLGRPSSGRYAGAVLGASSAVGHLLRDHELALPVESETQVQTVIVGGGIAGLSAAWWLKKNDYSDFLLLELEDQVGGNSQSGRNAIGAYPWGAHYVPLPGPDARFVRMLFEELGVISGYDARGVPIYDELALCADPHERLFLQGRWQEGLVPNVGLSPEDTRQYAEFFAAMENYKVRRGRDGKRAFSIPVDMSSRDPVFTALDGTSMEDYMRGQGWTSRSLHWYVRYCCRDDYGMGHDQVSAWVGIHYFASRTGEAANADSQTVLTWPEGNGWLVARLRERFPEKVRSNSLVHAVRATEEGVAVDYLDVETKRPMRIWCERVIFAAPRFVAARVIRGAAKSTVMPAALRYAPWMVANVSLRALPGGNGAPLSWDNVSYYSQSLGYIVATHQNISLQPRQTVITYYRPLDEQDPVASRKAAVDTTHDNWARLVADDLEKMHRGIKEHIASIDVWVWGHGMVSPTIGFIWGKERRKMQASLGPIHFAHSDMSGISTFEEAQYRGVRAADQVLEALRLKRTVAA